MKLIIICAIITAYINMNCVYSVDPMTAAKKCFNNFPGMSFQNLKEQPDKNPLEDPVAQCFFACFLKGIDLMDSSGNIRYNLETLPEFFVSYVAYIDICIAVNEEPVTDGKEGCERAGKLLKCFKENNLDYYSMSVM